MGTYMRTTLVTLSSLFILSVLSACGGISLAEDVTPPPGYQPAQVQGVAQESTAYPLLPPDPVDGAAIYAEKCLPCHGASGMGDGPMAGNLPSAPPAIGSAEVSRQARPADWFDVVTNGRIDQMMPGFSGSLNDRQRWDVVAYVFSLSTSTETLAEGKAIYEQECVACHGQNGEGSANAPNWTGQDRLAVLSNVELADIVANGQGSMPAYADQLSEGRRWAVIDYVRSLVLAANTSQGESASQVQSTPQGTGQAAGTSEPTAAAETPAPGATLAPDEERQITIHGTVADASGAAGAAGLAVVLDGFEGMNQAFENETTTAADGSYTFTNVPVKSGMAYMVRVSKDGYSYNSDILHAADVSGESAELPVTLFDTTTDASGLVAERLHVFFDFSQPGTVQVVQLYIISNPTGKTVVAAAADQPALAFQVPGDAANLQFDGGSLGDRFVQTADGFGDLEAVQPDPEQHQVLFSYDLPYDRKLSLEIPVSLNVNAAVVMLPTSGIKLQSDQLMDSGSRDVQGMTYQLYTAANVAKGSALKIDLSGKVNSSAPEPGSDQTGLFIGLGVFVVVLAGGGYGWFRRRRLAAVGADPVSGESALESEDDLLDAILALDDLHQAGKISDDAYEQRRAELKEQLKQALNR
jgi:mono/diheme cytochrome c family protein